ncbi:tetratricopeptide repeat protein [Halomonas sp. SpR1]|uniref:tetratricopeptide repeat protein n=1 Tax=Halomonas sp. SpR1 TaxID=3050462 RepID=UPI0027E55EF2|nr:tetratricopeptide repeat protein [Halomonas sp. SpR1]MDQ7735560.1 tetratricopeptide repeat protein [Halomonas sp. SpR1]
MSRIIVVFFTAWVLTGCAATHTQQTQQQGDGKLRMQLEKANTALQEARLMDAEVLYSNISSGHPELPDVWLKLGNIYARQGRNAAAIRTYNEGLKYQPNDGKIWYNLAVIQTKVAIETLEDASNVLEADNTYLPRIQLLHESLLDVSRPTRPSQ